LPFFSANKAAEEARATASARALASVARVAGVALAKTALAGTAFAGTAFAEAAPPTIPVDMLLLCGKQKPTNAKAAWIEPHTHTQDKNNPRQKKTHP
jgi:hypothetical protein